MAQRRVRIHRDPLATTGPSLEPVFRRIRTELGLPEFFPAQVLAAAAEAARNPKLPELDLTQLPFFTIDPVGSRDLDQALHLERTPGGYRVQYAIAHLPAFVAPGSALDLEARRRGQTLYSPDVRTPLHPPVLSEDAASLLPGRIRPAYVWELQLDAEGELRSANLREALVRSVERLDYESLQQQWDAGHPDERLQLLGEIGQLRLRLEAERGGANLPLPEQEIEVIHGHYTMRWRPQSAVEQWNAQISLLTGMAAADIMLAGQIGILRTMPGPTPAALALFRRQAQALNASWPAELEYGAFLRTLEHERPQHLALIHEATSLFRGADYTPFDGAPPEAITHAAVADQYAHVTAPLRRLVDRFGLVICASLCSDQQVPGWVRQGLMQLPEQMRGADRQARRLDRATTDTVEAAALAHRVGQEFTAVAVNVSEPGEQLRPSQIQLLDPAVLATVKGSVTLGSTIQVRLTAADVASRTVEFELA